MCRNSDMLVGVVDHKLGAKCTEGLESNSAVKLSVCINNMMRSRMMRSSGTPLTLSYTSVL